MSDRVHRRLTLRRSHRPPLRCPVHVCPSCGFNADAENILRTLPRDPDAAEHLAVLADGIGTDETVIGYRERQATG